MPPEVIDLVSSPEPEPANTSPKTATTTNPPAKELTYGSSNLIGSSWNWDALPSDDSEVLPIPKPPPAKPATVFKERTSNTNGTKESAKTLQEDSGGFIPIHDDSDDPFKSDPPPAKRRRVSSSPQAGPSKKTVPKTSSYKRSISNIETSTKVSGSSRSTNAAIVKRTTGRKPADDILFTSSPDYIAEAARKRKAKQETRQESDDSDELPDINAIRKYTGQPKASRSKATTTCTIDEDSEENGYGLPQRSKTDSIAPQFELGSFDFSSEPELPPTRTAKSAPKTSKTKGSSEAVLDKYNAIQAKEKAARERKEKAAEKATANLAEKEKKRLEKEEKSRKKEQDAEIAKANMRRTDKKISIKEMIVDMPSCLNLKLKDQVRTFLTSKDAEHTEFESTLPLIKWRRNVDRVYNKEKDMWDAAPKRVKSEDHVMCVLLAKEFVDLVTADEGQDLDAHVLKLKSKFNSCKIIYLIEGFMAWSRKNRNTEHRQFQARVNSHLPEPPTASQKRKKKKDDEHVDENLIEDALLNLQVIHGALIHHTNVINETAEWVVNFTEQISLKPEKLKSHTLDTTFCMESGQVKTGEDPQDTYVKMLQEMNRITQPVAWGIVSEYPTVQQLVQGLREEGPLALANCRKSANGNGAFQDRKIGPAISRRVHAVFTERDPTSMDV